MFKEGGFACENLHVKVVILLPASRVAALIIDLFMEILK